MAGWILYPQPRATWLSGPVRHVTLIAQKGGETKEFSAFSAEISDEEFEEYMAFSNAELELGATSRRKADRCGARGRWWS
jgi:hypothetical protein